MQFFKSISILAAALASLTSAAPMPQMALQVGKNGGVASEVPVSQQQAPASVVTHTNTITITPGVSAPTPAVVTTSAAAPSAPATTAAPSLPLTKDLKNVVQQTSQTSSAAASSSSSQAPSSSSGSSSGGSSQKANGQQLLIVNKCNKGVKVSQYAGLHNDQVAPDSTIEPGSSHSIPITGSSQAVWVGWEGADFFTDNSHSIVEWNIASNGATPFVDLSLLKGNPFGQYGQTFEMPSSCPTKVVPFSNILNCQANQDCLGSYYSYAAPDAGTPCPAVTQGQGLTYTLCEA